MIVGKCSILNGKKGHQECKWPVTFAALPRKGDKVIGQHPERDHVYTVVDIKHSHATAHDKAVNRSYEVPKVIVVITWTMEDMKGEQNEVDSGIPNI